MKTAIIFGASGQDGGFLTRLLLEKQYRVVCVSRHSGNSAFENLKKLGVLGQVEPVQGLITDSGRVEEIITEFRPSEIYNMAGQSSVGRSFEIPKETFDSIALGTMNILEAVRRLDRDIRFFNAGSGECFGNTGETAITESTPICPQSPYGAAKAAAAHLVAVYRQAYGIFACTGILFNHESHLRPEKFVTRKIVRTACRIAKGECNELALGNISIERDWGWAPEYVEAMWMMLRQEVPEDYILATGTTISLENFISAVFDRLGLDWQHYVRSVPEFYRPADIQVVRTNPEKARRRLGWQARTTGLDVAKKMVENELKAI